MACANGQCHWIPSARPDCCAHRWRACPHYTTSCYDIANFGSVEGNAASTAPVMGWATPDLAKYLGTSFVAQSRSATRAIPTTEPTSKSSPEPPAKKTNIGAIAGGTIGGLIVLIGVIALVFLCLRSRRRKQNTQREGQPSETTSTSDPRSPEMAQKSIATSSVLQGSTLHSPIPQSAINSPQGSPPPAPSQWHGEMHDVNSYYQESPNTHHQSGDWTQHGNYASQGNYPYQQTYYPPPPEPSQSHKQAHTHTMSVELPNIRSPANVVAEMPQVNSPLPDRGDR